MIKLVVCIMGQNAEKTIGMALESVKDADSIVYCDGGSTDKTIDYLYGKMFRSWKAVHKNNISKIIIENEYDQEDLGMNGKQRNFYLKYLKEKYPDYWALCIDADEVVQDLDKVKAFIQEAVQEYTYAIPIRHLIGSLAHEDSTQDIHIALGRLFKLDNKLVYPEVEHPVIQGKEIRAINIGCLWHLAYIPGLWDLKKKYLNHLKKSNMHSPEFLRRWYFQHLFGVYPKKQFNPMEMPDIILKEFDYTKDEIYYTSRNQMEVKHYIIMRQWLDYFKPKSILDLGAGLGLYGEALKTLDKSIEYKGVEQSKWVSEHTQIVQGDIRTYSDKKYDLVILMDVLEHLEEKDLDKALKNISTLCKQIVFSIPFLGDPNLMADITHKIFKPKVWWIQRLSKYFKIKEAPKEWLFSPQMLIGESK